MPLSLLISFHPLHLLSELFAKEVLSEVLEQPLEPQCIFGDRVLIKPQTHDPPDSTP